MLGQSEPHEAWLYWVLEMEGLYPKGSLKFERPGAKAKKTEFMDTNTMWDNVLAGKALERFRSDFVSPAFSEALARLNDSDPAKRISESLNAHLVDVGVTR